MVSVRAIILAAGSGKRIGQPKLYLKLGEKYFLDIICENLFAAGIRNISTVIAESFENSLFVNSKKLSWVINPNPQNGMISSVYCGVSKYHDETGYMIIPVDHPKILSGTFRNLQAIFFQNPETVVIASCNGVSGHPLIIPRSLARQIKNSDYPEGLRGIIQSSGKEIISVETNDPGVLKNINTQNDLSELNS